MTEPKPEVLFLCVHNAGRSQMAAGFARALGGGRIVVHSAGADPSATLNPAVVEVMHECGIDISHERPTRISDETVRRADVIVTMGCGDACKVYVGKQYVDWALPDPSGLPVTAVRAIRDQIAARVGDLIAQLLGP